MTEVRLCSVGDVPVGEARRFVVGKAPIAVVHLDDGWYAVSDTCTHQKISLAEGEVHPETHQIECWKHGSCFSLVDGTPHSLPATRPVAVYPVRVSGDDVIVLTGDGVDQGVRRGAERI
jgi:3-phenylpropionate/trans-cinnamate dioxygenase ferredoxin subunit